LTAQAPQGDFRCMGADRVPGGLQQPPAGRTGHVTEWTLLDLQLLKTSCSFSSNSEQPNAA
jgi:hypothetical protein